CLLNLAFNKDETRWIDSATCNVRFDNLPKAWQRSKIDRVAGIIDFARWPDKATKSVEHVMLAVRQPEMVRKNSQHDRSTAQQNSTLYEVSAQLIGGDI